MDGREKEIGEGEEKEKGKGKWIPRCKNLATTLHSTCNAAFLVCYCELTTTHCMAIPKFTPICPSR